MPELKICLPGQRLCVKDETHHSGNGTYERQGYIYSNVAGVVDVVQKNNIKVIEVVNPDVQTIVPAHGDIVTAEVTIITQQYVKCLIKCIGNKLLKRHFKGVLRREDIRAAEKDRIEIFKCFRPGDIILARVMPITEAHVYQLSTAENELGVAIAHSEHGHPMVPISWIEMQCTKTYVKEPRKVARIIPEKIHNDIVNRLSEYLC
ncbi:exosome complex component CSL4 [Coccinella septempunctata]|uniref:exosome complex component CSL4 n=1 Tax=Coccinella septempunctata TaxID=41139 RepID=UPI001D075FCD|nr:exosome complex component CSL4 [Coccinella septempunctata]